MTSWSLDVEPSPAVLVLPPDVDSLDEAHAAIELWEHYSGKRLDPTQRLVVEVMMAQTADGRWAAATTGREMPRQNGKGDEIEVVELWGLVHRAEAILHTVHDAVLLATQTQQRMLGVVEGHADLRRRLKRVWRGTGQQMIEMKNGGVIWYRTRTGGGGRGVDDISRLVIDEAQHATEEQLSAVTPTLLANVNPQLNATGTAGLEGRSEWWWRIRRRALTADPGQFGYVGHTAENLRLDGDGNVVADVPDITDRDVWAACNPSVAAGRGGGLEFLQEQFHRLGPVGFAQEHLCVWAPDTSRTSGGPVSVSDWADLVDGESLPEDGSVRLSLDAPPTRETATFGIAGRRADGLTHVSIRLHVPPADMRGLIATAKQLCDGHQTSLILPPNSPARAWRSDLLEAGVEVDELTAAEYAEACGAIAAKIQEGVLRHRGQPLMDAAVGGLSTRATGDVETWSRRSSSANISPFVAATCALLRVPDTEPAFAGDYFVDLDGLLED